MGWSLLGRAEPQLWLEKAEGTKLTDGLISLIDDTIMALSLLNNACLGKVPMKHSLPLAKILPVSCHQRTGTFLTLSLDLGHNS